MSSFALSQSELEEPCLPALPAGRQAAGRAGRQAGQAGTLSLPKVF